MCGICGIVRRAPGSDPPDLGALRRMRSAMARRGPDGEGEWVAADGGVALGHRRLAILDLSPGGAQPMADPSGRYRIVFNGEIYNFRELRAGLESRGDRFTTGSDTEVILALWARDGERAVARLRGMYAFAIHDALERSVTLVRDPFGIKPLYYERRAGELRFASQVKALEAGGASLEVDPGGIAGFLLWGSVPEPWTIRRSIRALPAGHLLVIRDGVVGEPRPAAPFEDAPLSADSLAGEMQDSVRAHLVSDVPVAVFLSSGLDSALITALAVRERAVSGEREPVSTFTVTFAGWEGTERDEGPLAARVARALGTNHIERRLTRDDVAEAWPAALAAMDQPSIDGFNTFVVARAAHEAGIKVALSGLGGDELFGSYPSFRDVPRWARGARTLAAIPGAGALWPRLARAAKPDRPKLQGLAKRGRTLAGAYYLRRGLFLPEDLPGLLGDDLARAGLAEFDPVAYAERALHGSTVFRNGEPAETNGDAAATAWESVQRLEQSLYMRNQLLRDSDWAAMASSLELRVPMLDVPLWRAMERARFEPARSSGKAALVRDIAATIALHLPPELWSRPKTGFTVPIAEWMLPPRQGERDSAGKGSRRIARRLLEKLLGEEISTSAGEPRADRLGSPRPASIALGAGPRRRALIATIPPLDGGVRAMLDTALRVLAAENIEPVVAWYEPFSLSPGLSVPGHRMGTRRPGFEVRAVDRAAAAHAIGAWLPELEFTHNWPTRHWRALIAAADLHLVVSGNCLPGLAFERTRTPFLAWLASDWHGDRKDRAAAFPFHRRLVDCLLTRPVARRFERRILRSGRMLALSEATRRELDRVAGRSVVRGVLPQSIDLDLFVPDAARVEPGLVGFVGRFDDPRKNFSLFLESLAAVRAAGVMLRAEVLGTQPREGHLQQVDRLGLSGVVSFSGRLESSDFAVRLRRFDVLAVTSHQEGLGIAALEAMASGCPVVSTRCGGPEEFVIEGETGALTGFTASEIARRLAEIVSDRPLRARLGDGARRMVRERYTRSRVEHDLRSELRSLQEETMRGATQ